MSKLSRSSIYLAGNKYKLLPQILPHLLVEGRDTFVDVFGGSGTVSLNVNNTRHFKTIVYNELDEHIFGLQDYIRDNNNNFAIVEYLHGQYDSSKEDFLKLRESYNTKPDYDKLYLLMCRANSNMIRFNNSGKFNMTWGDRKPFDKERLINHKKILNNPAFFDSMCNESFQVTLDRIIKYGKPDVTVIYLDPPYMATLATYNTGWGLQDNTDLLQYADKLISKGFKVVMSNVFKNRGNTHQQLIDWCAVNKEIVDVHHLDISYNNSSFRKSSEVTDEVLIVSK